MPEIVLDVWLYGELRRYGGDTQRPGHANPKVRLPEGSVLADLLAYLEMPTGARGITFVNGLLSAMPGLQPDLQSALKDGDRVAFFDLHSMWPFQYRQQAAMTPEMREAMAERPDGGLHHTYTSEPD